MIRKHTLSVAVALTTFCAANGARAQAACSTGACGNNACVQQGTCIEFSGHCWDIKDSRGAAWGPGPNVFSPKNVWIDAQCKLHLQITRQNGAWTCAELINQQSHGYGTYRVTYDTRVDDLDANAVLALFTWSDDPAFANREIDIEFSRWGKRNSRLNAQYVVQPYTDPLRIFEWRVPGGTSSTHSFTWQPDSVLFRSVLGSTVVQWPFAGDDVPPEGDEHARMNLWLFRGRSPRRPVEVVVSRFEYQP
jgi:hypothetical protein